MPKKSGYTLLEIIFVIIIISVLTSLALPTMSNTFERFRAAEGVQIVTALLHAQKARNQEVGSYTNNLTDLDVTIDNPRYFTVSVSTNVARLGMATRSPNGDYRIDISDTGTITCANLAGPFTCAQAGY